MIVYIYNIGVDLYNGFNGLRHRINWTYFTVLDGLAHPLYSSKEVYVDLLAKKEHDTGTLVDVLLVGKYLERICDHCVNIGKWVLYQKSGVFEEIE